MTTRERLFAAAQEHGWKVKEYDHGREIDFTKSGGGTLCVTLSARGGVIYAADGQYHAVGAGKAEWVLNRLATRYLVT